MPVNLFSKLPNKTSSEHAANKKGNAIYQSTVSTLSETNSLRTNNIILQKTTPTSNNYTNYRVGGYNVETYKTWLTFQKEINFSKNQNIHVKNIYSSYSKKINSCRCLNFSDNENFCKPNYNYNILENMFLKNNSLDTNTAKYKICNICDNIKNPNNCTNQSYYNKIKNYTVNNKKNFPNLFLQQINENRTRGFNFPSSTIVISNGDCNENIIIPDNNTSCSSVDIPSINETDENNRTDNSDNTSDCTSNYTTDNTSGDSNNTSDNTSDISSDNSSDTRSVTEPDSDNDIINIDSEHNIIYGGPGDDIINSSADYNIIYGESGDDRINIDANYNIIYGGSGNDNINIIGGNYNTVFGNN